MVEYGDGGDISDHGAAIVLVFAEAVALGVAFFLVKEAYAHPTETLAVGGVMLLAFLAYLFNRRLLIPWLDRR